MRFNLALSSVALAALAAALPAQAASFLFVTVPGATSGSYTVSGSASFTTLAGEVDVTLTNFFAQDLVSVAQNLSGVSFDVSALTSSGTVGYVAGSHVTLNTPTTPVAASGTPVWNLARSGANLYLSVFGAGQPKNTLLPYTDASVGNDYSSANSSITGAVHNPYYLGTVTFAITGLAGVTSDSSISNVVFRYNTDATRVPAVPEPGTYAMMLGGLAAVGFVARRRKLA